MKSWLKTTLKIIGGATIGAGIAAGVNAFSKKKHNNAALPDFEEDFDDFDEEFDDSEEVEVTEEN